MLDLFELVDVIGCRIAALSLVACIYFFGEVKQPFGVPDISRISFMSLRERAGSIQCLVDRCVDLFKKFIQLFLSKGVRDIVVRFAQLGSKHGPVRPVPRASGGDSFHVEVQVIEDIIMVRCIVLLGDVPALDHPREGVTKGNVNTRASTRCFKCRGVSSVVDNQVMLKQVRFEVLPLAVGVRTIEIAMCVGIDSHDKSHGVLGGIGGDIIEPCRNNWLGDVKVGTHGKQDAPSDLDLDRRTVTMLKLWYRCRVNPGRDEKSSPLVGGDTPSGEDSNTRRNGNEFSPY